MAGSASFGMDGSGAYRVMGYVAGIAEEIQTPVYVAAVLKYAHARLSEYFDLWMDELAKRDPDSFMHVYEWPSEWGDEKPDYEETVGNPEYRLWAHTLTGPAQNAVASFVFLPSVRPTPVNPILAAEGVKTGIHVFEMKATVMEYGLPVHINPKLAHYLAYVLNGSKGGGTDHGFTFAKTTSEGDDIGFSRGQVNVTRAGGQHTFRKFTDAFTLWYKTEGPSHMANEILPRVESDIMMAANRLGTAGLVGSVNKTKYVNMAGWASSTQEAYGKAKAEARAVLKEQENNYIQQAAARRRDLYGV